MWPSLIIGIMVFVFILLMVKAIHYTEFVLVHGLGLEVVGQIMGYSVISFLPALLPMSLLFSVLMTYGRLSHDSEIVALKATGHSMWSILFPAFLLSILVAFISSQTSFHLAPWGNRQFEVLITKLGQTKAGASIREGTFSEGFFDMVVYANSVDSKKGELTKVFIFDERDADSPLTVIAKSGQLVQDPKNPGHSALLRLFNGNIHRKSESHTKINFNSFDIRLIDPVKYETREKSPPSLTIDEINDKLKAGVKDPEMLRTLQTEYNKRWAIAAACIIFALLGVGLGTNPNSRRQKSGGLVISLVVVILYWIIYVSAEGFARSGQAPVQIAIWTPNLIFFLFSLWSLKRVWN